MRDNKTSQPASVYDSKIEKTIPFYRMFHEQAIDLVREVRPNPQIWLDAGGGTGLLIERAARIFPKTRFVLSDPSESMLKMAEGKFASYPQIKFESVLAGTEELDFPDESFDVITAIISHHYFDVKTRKLVTKKCMKMLKKGGIYINVESVSPLTPKGKEIGIARWRQLQLNNGKTEEEVAKHLGRFGKEFFPIRIQEHLMMMQESGFLTVELFWASIMQAGFYGIK